MIALKVLLLSFIAAKVDGHGYSKSPRSRNFVARQDGKWSGGTANDPQIETCHHCLNRESGGGCGVAGTNDYNNPRNALGNPMPVNIQETFVRGQEFDFEAVLTAHHKGHFEYKACPIQPGGKGSQECFDNHKLDFVKDLLYNAPKDPNYPERAYIPLAGDTMKEGSNYIYKHRYKLPDNLIGELVLIQWHYVTANSCLPKGYDTYNWPTGWYPGSLGTCGDPLPADGNGTPEQFWNCAEVKITSGGSSPVAPPVSTPIAAPTLSPIQPTPAPVLATPAPVIPTSAPVSSPVQLVECPNDYTGLIKDNDCTAFYHCHYGELISEVPIECPEGLLYKSDELCMCNFVFVL